MEVEIGFLKDAELGKTAGSVFYKENWKRKTALSIQEFYDWQFCQLPGLENEDLCCSGSRKQQIIGHYGSTLS